MKLDSIIDNIQNASTDSILVKEQIILAQFYLKQDLNTAQKTYFQALKIIQKSGYPSNYWHNQECYIYDSLGVLSRKKSNYEEALSYYLRSLKIKEAQKDSINLGRSYHNIAMLFKTQKDLKNARKHMYTALPLRKKFNSKIQYGKTLNFYGSILFELGKIDSAKWYFKQAKNHLRGSPKEADVNTQLAKLYRSQQNFKTAIKIYKENLDFYNKEGLTERFIVTQISLAHTYRIAKQYELCYQTLEAVKPLAIKLNNTNRLISLYLEYCKFYKIKNDSKKELFYYKKYIKYKDTTYNLKRIQKIEALKLDYTYSKKRLADSLNFKIIEQKLIAQNTSEIKQKQLYSILFIVTLLSLIALYILYLYKKKLSLQKSNKEQLENELLNEKLNNITQYTKHLKVDNKMRLLYKQELLSKIKTIKEHKNIKEYQSLIVDLQRQISTEKRLDEFSENSTGTNLQFDKKLIDKYPKLTKSERELCNLIVLNLSTKEIMNIRNVSEDSIKSARYRIRKKIGVPKSVELELFIKGLF